MLWCCFSKGYFYQHRTTRTVCHKKCKLKTQDHIFHVKTIKNENDRKWKSWNRWRKEDKLRRETVRNWRTEWVEGFLRGAEWCNGWDESGISWVTKMKRHSLVSPVLTLTSSIIYWDSDGAPDCRAATQKCVINLFAYIYSLFMTHAYCMY